MPYPCSVVVTMAAKSFIDRCGTTPMDVVSAGAVPGARGSFQVTEPDSMSLLYWGTSAPRSLETTPTLGDTNAVKEINVDHGAVMPSNPAR